MTVPHFPTTPPLPRQAGVFKHGDRVRFCGGGREGGWVVRVNRETVRVRWLDGTSSRFRPSLLDPDFDVPTRSEWLAYADPARAKLCPMCRRLSGADVGDCGDYWACDRCRLTWCETGKFWRHRDDGYPPALLTWKRPGRRRQSSPPSPYGTSNSAAARTFVRSPRRS